MRIYYTDGRTGLTTTSFRYRLYAPDGTLLKDWTTDATWTEEPAGSYYLDDADAVPGTVYAVEPSAGAVGGWGRVDEPMRGTDGANTTAPDNASVTAIKAKTDNLPADTAAELTALAAAMPDADALTLALAILRNKTTDDGTTVTLYADDGTTPLGTWTWDAATKTRGRLT